MTRLCTRRSFLAVAAAALFACPALAADKLVVRMDLSPGGVQGALQLAM
jgi:hypothetical protein